MMQRRPADLIVVPGVIPARLAAAGIDPQRLLRRADLPADLFSQGKARITTRQLFAIWTVLAAMDPDPALGLRLGSEGATEHYDIASIAALHSPNFEEALQRFARYKRLTCPEVIRIERSDGEVRVRFQWLLVDAPSPDLLTDATFASVLELVRRGTGTRVVPRRIELTRAPAQEALLASHFGCTPRFGAAKDFIVFDESLLSIPFVTHNQDLLAMLLPGLEAALDAQPVATSLVEQARVVMNRAMRGERPSMQSVARELCVSTRTLQRRLEEAGTSYQKLLDEVRRQAARQLLEDTELEAGEIAFVLGFEELNSFTRAFRGWEGTTPVRWRNGLVGRRA